MLFRWDYFSGVWFSHGLLDLGWLLLFQSTFVSSLTLIGCRLFVCLQWFLAVTLRPVLLDLIKCAEFLAFEWIAGQILSCLWTPFGWIVTEAQRQITVEFAEHREFFLVFASVWATRYFEVSKGYPKPWKSIFRESHCKSPIEFTRIKNGTFGRYTFSEHSDTSTTPDNFAVTLCVDPMSSRRKILKFYLCSCTLSTLDWKAYSCAPWIWSYGFFYNSILFIQHFTVCWHLLSAVQIFCRRPDLRKRSTTASFRIPCLNNLMHCGKNNWEEPDLLTIGLRICQWRSYRLLQKGVRNTCVTKFFNCQRKQTRVGNLPWYYRCPWSYSPLLTTADKWKLFNLKVNNGWVLFASHI